MNNLGSDRVQFWGLVTVPVLSAPVYHATLVTLYHVSEVEGGVVRGAWSEIFKISIVQQLSES